MSKSGKTQFDGMITERHRGWGGENTDDGIGPKFVSIRKRHGAGCFRPRGLGDAMRDVEQGSNMLL